jgi:hypothetical protein
LVEQRRNPRQATDVSENPFSKSVGEAILEKVKEHLL